MQPVPPKPHYDTALVEIAGDNKHALEFMRALYAFVHLIDDWVDQDTERSGAPPYWTSVLLQFIFTIAKNPFFQDNREVLLPLIHQAAVAHAESERLRKSENITHRLAAETLKSGYQEIFYYCAYLLGGYNFQVTCSEKFRDYDFG